jgi:hypothetical protein
MKVCDQKHGGFYVTIDLFSWGFPLTRGSNVRGRQSSTPPGFYSDLGIDLYYYLVDRQRVYF